MRCLYPRLLRPAQCVCFLYYASIIPIFHFLYPLQQLEVNLILLSLANAHAFNMKNFAATRNSTRYINLNNYEARKKSSIIIKLLKFKVPPAPCCQLGPSAPPPIIGLGLPYWAAQSA